MEISISDTNIEGVKIINYDTFSDKRGTIWTTFIDKKLNKLDINKFNHDKFSLSYKNVIRGIHYDKFTTKLVTIVYGSINQIVVDMRDDSPTFKQYLSFELNNENRFSILIPPMVGNAFQVKSDFALYHYKLSYSGDYQDEDKQFTTKWNDPTIGIKWNCSTPILSNRDS